MKYSEISPLELEDKENLDDAQMNDLLPEEISLLAGMKKITKNSFPMMLSSSMSFIMLASAILSGRLNNDKDHIAATTLIIVMANAESAISFAPLFSVGLLVSRNFGDYEFLKTAPRHETWATEYKLKKQRIANYNKNGIMLSLGIAAIPTLTLSFSKPILVLFGQDEKAAAIADEYLKIFAIAMFGWGWRVINEQMMYSCRKQDYVALIGLTTFFTSLGLSYEFGFGNPNLRLKGIALGFVVEAYLSPIIFTTFLSFNKDLRPFKFFRKWSLNYQQDWPLLKEILKTSFPMFLALASEFGAQIAMNSLMGILGNDELAAQNFMAQFFFFTFIPLVAFAQATSQEFSRAFGGKHYFNANKYAKSGILSVAAILLPACIVMASYPQMIVSLLTDEGSNPDENNRDWLQLVNGLAPVSTAGIFFDALGFNMLQVLRATGDNIVPSCFSVGSVWLGVLSGYLLGFKAGWGVYGVSAGYTAGLAVRAASLFTRWRQKIKPENLKAEAEAKVSIAQERGIFHTLKKVYSGFFSSSSEKTSKEHLLQNVVSSTAAI